MKLFAFHFMLFVTTTHLVDGTLRAVLVVKTDERPSAASVDGGVVDGAEPTKLLPEIPLGHHGGNTAQPHAVGRSAFTKAQLHEGKEESSVIAAVMLLNQTQLVALLLPWPSCMREERNCLNQ